MTTTEDLHKRWNKIPVTDVEKFQPPISILPTHSFLSPSSPTDAIISNVPAQPPVHAANCRMDNCFDFSRCKRGFKVHVYPVAEGQKPSDYYIQIINVIKQSPFYTADVDEACVYVSGIDTLDRDRLSADYVHNLQTQLSSLSHWNSGRNHVIFNLYSGTWPDYSEHFGIDIGYAILAKASVSSHKFRAAFDISLPLFHKTLPVRGGGPGLLSHVKVPSNKKYLLSFKGKRYVTGIGSISRNSLHHIHNGEDIVLLTTCKHGKDWQRYADARCLEDNELYDK